MTSSPNEPALRAMTSIHHFEESLPLLVRNSSPSDYKRKQNNNLIFVLIIIKNIGQIN